MAYVGVDNAIGWAQFASRGGMKNTLLTSGIYALAIAGGVLLTVQLGGFDAESMYNWAVGLLALQGFILVLFGASRVHVAIRADINSGIIESHRLMPMPPVHAVLGYVFGATSQASALAAVNFLLGGVIARMGDVEPLRWITAQCVLAVFAVFIWTIVAALAFSGKMMVGWLVFVGVSIWFSSTEVLNLLPGEMALASPLIGRTIFGMRPELTWAHLVSMAAQVWIATICCFGAARRYARNDASTLNALQALALLAAWVLVSVVATEAFDEFKTAGRWWSSVDVEVQFLWTLFVTLLMSVVPVANAARAQSEWEQRRRWDGARAGRRPIPPIVVILVATAMLAGLGYVMRGIDDHFARIRLTAAIVGFFLLQMSYLLRWTYQVVPRGLFMGGLWIVLTWLGPMLVDLMLHVSSKSPYDYVPSVIAMISPIGALLATWEETPWRREVVALYAGIAVQGVLTILPALLYWRSRRKQQIADRTEYAGRQTYRQQLQA